MNRELIAWADVMKIPSPETILVVLWQIIIYFWKAELDPEFYRNNSFPHNVSDILLHIDHSMYQKIRYHVYTLNNQETTGVWDVSPYWVDFTTIQSNKSKYLDHGDYRHPFQLFLRSFLRSIRKYTKFHPSLERVSNIISKLPLLHWKCPVCKKYDEWSHNFIETALLESGVSISSSTFLYLISYKNNKIYEKDEERVETQQCKELIDILHRALLRFFNEFQKIYEQTSTDPTLILKNLIEILEEYTDIYTIDQIHEFEQSCSKKMKSYLYNEFKFMKTKTIGINNFPRDMIVIRDIFPMIIRDWCVETDSSATSSPCVLMLCSYILFKDPALESKLTTSEPLVVFQPFSTTENKTIRHMTPSEIDNLVDYHPLIRSNFFVNNV